MAVQTSYPGVYMVEAESGVHTITGVATSITAFLGHTARGVVNRPTRILSLADYERAFGGLSPDSPVSYAVRHFYTNGGTEAYVVRVAHGAVAALTLARDAVSGGTGVLRVQASSAGTWGNNLRIGVDYATANPGSLFNIRVTELIDQGGELVPGRTEEFLNLSMDSKHPSYVVELVNARSDLIVVSRPTLTFGNAGTSTSGVIQLSDVSSPSPPTPYRVAYTLNGEGPFEATVTAPGAPSGTGTPLAQALNPIVSDLQGAINAVSPPGVTVTSTGTQLVFTANLDATHLAEQSSIHFVDASSNSMTARLRLGPAYGGTEVDGSAQHRPVQTGSVGAGGTSGATSGSVDVTVNKAGTTVKGPIQLDLWGPPPIDRPAPSTVAELVSLLNAAFLSVGRTEPLLLGARAMLVAGQVRVVPGGTDPDLGFTFSGTMAGTLNLNALVRNVGAYAPGSGATFAAQTVNVPANVGNNGTPPTAAELSGDPTLKTGLFALEDVDLFNLMVIPEASVGAGMGTVVTDAIAYCQRRRAFLILDVPENQDNLTKVSVWAQSPAAGAMRSRNSALFFPRVRIPDPRTGLTSTFGVAGALAGVFARTDAERGVWKAPAGIGATIAGATGLSYKLTDMENGVLNPLAINCLRIFPVYGTVNWGARTGRGADALADQYKYIPIRRLALFMEESLYRGTQWVVFEPNDEPLWAQIRLNLAAFMHGLFAQGAFQGKTPRDAYFVKCDGETTTQNDRDLGRVNIVVGFAPLKPAEFVIITIQQIAGNIPT
jgi:phage tail sheath protein FI